MRRLFWAFPAVVIPAAFAAGPTTDTNVVTSASDAFGTILGPESVGLYSPGSIRGFSPLTAGNVRIDGLYFDLQGGMIDRLATDTRIRVGLSATTFPWPAPSGIVDYTLREPKATPDISTIIYAGPYESRDIDLDGSTEFLDGQFGIAAGGSYHDDELNPEQTARTVSWGILPTWHPNSSISVRTFWGRQTSTDTKPQAVIYPVEGQALPPISPHYYGPSWANSDGDSQHYGMLVKAELSPQWSVYFGLFHSTLDLPRTYSDLYLNTTAEGIADHFLVVEPVQHYGSSSGDFQLSYKVKKGTWKQEVLFGVRGRSVSARYGGAESIDLGIVPVEQPERTQPPKFAFGAAMSNRIREYSSGISYRLGWYDRVNFTAGLRRDTYSNVVADPNAGSSFTTLQPWLYNFSLAFLWTKSLTVFSTLTRGLEDSGVAPMNTVNRGQVLPATRSSQEEIGAKYAPSSSLSILAGAFEIDKSYFALDQQNEFGNLGQERHRGLEFSLTGEVTPALHLVTGILFMSPEVLARSAPQEAIGRLPIGQPHRLAQAGLDYSPTWLPAFSVDSVLSYSGSRAASVDDRIVIPSFTTLDLGARYRFNLGEHSATLRTQVVNLTNTSNWTIANDGGLTRWPERRAWAYLIVEF